MSGQNRLGDLCLSHRPGEARQVDTLELKPL